MPHPVPISIRADSPSRSDIVTEPMDSENYSEQVGTRISPEMHGIMLHIVNDENAGYRGSVSRFIRHAIYELEVAWGKRLSPGNPVANWATWDMPQREREAELKRLLKFRGWLSTFEAAIRGYIADSDAYAVIEELLEIKRFINSIEGVNGRYWRRKCLGIVATAPAVMDAVKYLGKFAMYDEFLHEITSEWEM